MADQKSGTAVLSTLHRLTEKKLEKLEEHRNKFERQRKDIKRDIKESNHESIDQQIRTLLDGSAKCNAPLTQTGLNAKNITRFLDQRQRDSSISTPILEQWKTRLEKNLDTHALKYEYAGLFGRLVTEWMQKPNQPLLAKSRKDDGYIESETTSDTESIVSDFEQVGREEMHEQRKQWEEYTLSPRQTDPVAIRKYLDDLFSRMDRSKKSEKSPLENLQKQFREIHDSHPKTLTSSVVKTCIKALLRADLFADAKREALVSLLDREDTLNEIADVLNMDLENLEDWEWSTQPVSLHMRRQLNGKYRVYMDEELHEAILLQFLGLRLAVTAKWAFLAVFKSNAWRSSPGNFPKKIDRDRRQFYLGTEARSSITTSVKRTRRDTYSDEYFMSQLPKKFEAPTQKYEEDGGTDDDDSAKGKVAANSKQTILRLITTEMLISNRIHGSFTVLQSDFKWFGPGLPHSTIFAVLEYLDLDPKWLAFIKKFLNAPLSFASDGPNAQVHVRRRGIPMSHVLSDTLGEVVLFCLDAAVNQRTRGGNIYRLHDDLWFWGQAETCVQAWEAMQEFSTVMGMDLNMEKTGSVSISKVDKSTKKPQGSLPKGPVRWGFLELDSATSRWIICQEEVEEHIVELRRQLDACKSVFAWVQAYNSYVDRFFSTNFGLPARCLGRDHIEMLIKTFEHIHQTIFADDKGSVTAYLRKIIAQRFDIHDIPDGFFYFPIELGGLELRNPFIPLLSQVEYPHVGPVERVERAFEQEEEVYERCKESFENGEVVSASTNFTPADPDNFYSLEEHCRFMEDNSEPLWTAYNQLLGTSSGDDVESTPAVVASLTMLPSELRYDDAKFSRDWHSASSYWKWILELNAPEVMQRFGGVTMGDRGLIPIGLVKMLRSEKVRWQS